jgi:hypothetical protein
MKTIEAMSFVDAVRRKAERRSQFGYFLPKGYGGYTVVERPDLAKKYGTMIYEFTMDKAHPLTYREPGGTYYQRDNHGFSDQGSIPKPIQLFISKDRFPRSFYAHDSGCLMKGAYASGMPDVGFDFVHLSRKQVDDMLRLMVRAEGGSALQAYLIWLGVRTAVKVGLARDWK